MIKTITQYKTSDGKVFPTKKSAEKYEKTNKRIIAIEKKYLGGPRHQKVDDNEGYYQHDKKKLKEGWVKTVDIFRPSLKNYVTWWNDDASKISPMGFLGRLASDSGMPEAHLVGRFGCIDADGREFQQPYFAMNGAEPGNNKRVN